MIFDNVFRLTGKFAETLALARTDLFEHHFRGKEFSGHKCHKTVSGNQNIVFNFKAIRHDQKFRTVEQRFSSNILFAGYSRNKFIVITQLSGDPGAEKLLRFSISFRHSHRCYIINGKYLLTSGKQ